MLTLMTSRKTDSPLYRELMWMCEHARPPKLRTIRTFAEQEIIIPDGKFEGWPFEVSRQPAHGLWFDAIDSGQWRRYAFTGPRQSGKTLSGYVIPATYHLFEYRESAILGAPSMELAADKWREDLKPTIEASRYREFLPERGGGSRGGTPVAVQFRHGPTLRFMSGGGKDKKRAGFTARVILITEADGMDTAGENSREADKITQIEACADSFDEAARIYLECTVSIEEGRIWREITNGTNSRLALPCPHCGTYVTPEREHFVGWDGAKDMAIAQREATWVCPECGSPWSEPDRIQANERAKLVHKGQEVNGKGKIIGPQPATDTLGFRMTATNNLFMSARSVAAKEWRAAQDPDEANSEKGMRQFVWALPHEPEAIELAPLDMREIATRSTNHPRGQVPEDTIAVTCFVDINIVGVGCHWMAVAWMPNATGVIIDYGTFEVDRRLGIEHGITEALGAFDRDRIQPGFASAEGGQRAVDLTVYDAGWQTVTIYNHTRSRQPDQLSYMGFGSGQLSKHRYIKPRGRGSVVRWVGDDCHISRQKTQRVDLLEANVDAWKTWAAERLTTPVGQPGAVAFFQAATPSEHLNVAKHFTAEKLDYAFEPGKGPVVVWRVVRKANHFWDCFVGNCVAANRLGVKLIGEHNPKSTQQQNEWFTQQKRRARR